MKKAAEVLSGRAALVTGAAGGLGEAVARALQEAGCRLFLTSRDPERLSALQKRLGAPGHAADLRSEKACRDLVELAEKETGGLSILVQSAGVFRVEPLAEVTLESFAESFEVNVRAPVLLSRALAPAMARRGWGRIVHVGSSSSYEGFPETSVYCATKHALLGLSRALHREWKETGVRFLCVSPGSIRTPMGRQIAGQDWDSFLDPDEVARWIVRAAAADGTLSVEELRLNRLERS